MKPLNRLQMSPRKIALTALSLLGLLFLAGCVVTSVYPFYTAKDVVFEPKLPGRWANPDKPDATNEFWEFAREGTNVSYVLTIPDGEKRTAFQAHLFQLKPWTFLDATPVEKQGDFVPPHYLVKVVQVEPSLKMAVMDYKWLGDLLEKHPSALRHMRVDATPGTSGSGRLVITADTAELQKFIVKHAADTNAFPEDMNLRRQR